MSASFMSRKNTFGSHSLEICLSQLMGGFIRNNFERHLGPEIFESFGAIYTPILERGIVLVILWLIFLWMYRKKVFLRV